MTRSFGTALTDISAHGFSDRSLEGLLFFRGIGGENPAKSRDRDSWAHWLLGRARFAETLSGAHAPRVETRDAGTPGSGPTASDDRPVRFDQLRLMIC
ncbi:MAG: hypothetical protein CMJ53_04525 [Planctomycetaceae bacterium]|nr:hypothetical protein [Planctomycetaceae bacterium]